MTLINSVIIALIGTYVCIKIMMEAKYMSYVTQTEQELIQQRILLPIIIQILEHDRKRMLAAKHVLQTIYSQWVDTLIITIQKDLRMIKKECYHQHITVSSKQRRDDLLIYHCSVRGYSYEDHYTISAIKGHAGVLLRKYIDPFISYNKLSNKACLK